MEKLNEIKHIVRNGILVITQRAREQGRIIDNILTRCKEMEEALDKVEKDENHER